MLAHESIRTCSRTKRPSATQHARITPECLNGASRRIVYGGSTTTATRDTPCSHFEDHQLHAPTIPPAPPLRIHWKRPISDHDQISHIHDTSPIAYDRSTQQTRRSLFQRTKHSCDKVVTKSAQKMSTVTKSNSPRSYHPRHTTPDPIRITPSLATRPHRTIHRQCDITQLFSVSRRFLAPLPPFTSLPALRHRGSPTHFVYHNDHRANFVPTLATTQIANHVNPSDAGATATKTATPVTNGGPPRPNPISELDRHNRKVIR